METEALKAELGRIRLANANRDWLKDLDDRKKKELEFHNKHREKNRAENLPKDTYDLLYGNKKFYGAVRASHLYVDRWIERHAPGKVFLDYACGNGSQAIKAAQSGALLTIGLDISDVSIQNATARAATQTSPGSTIFLQGDCEETGLPDACVDVILCSGMLHHLDLRYALPELHRILAPGGRVLAVEALDYNPAIKLYRKLTPEMRTDWEKNHILSLKDVRFAKRFFDIGEIRYWHLLSILAAYVRNEEVRSLAVRTLNRVDAVLTRIPLLQLMSWQFTFEMIRPVERKDN